MTSNSVVNQVINIPDSAPATSSSDNSLEQNHQEFVKLCREIKQIKGNLAVKYQTLANLKQSFPEKTKIRSKINQQAKILNNLNFNLPNFLIIGTQKGGTTWLHENLKRHPQIFLPQGKKELEFFSYYQKKIADHGLNYYLEQFNQFEDLINQEKPKAIGEATPSYFWAINPEGQWSNSPNKNFNSQIPESVHQLLGDQLKLILCLRDPVERAISAYFHHIKRDRICYKSQRILDVGHLYGIIDMGFYNYHLNAWLRKYSLDNFKVLIYERDIKQNKQQTITDICNFLEVDHQLFPPATNLNQYHNQGLKYRSEADGVFLIFPNRKEEKLVISRDEIQQLRKIYAEDYQALQQTLKIDLSEFWKFSDTNTKPKAETKEHNYPELGKVSADNSAIAGKSGWFFINSGTNYLTEYHTGAKRLPLLKVDQWEQLLTQRIQWHEARKIAYQHIFVPNKIAVYPEYHPHSLDIQGDRPIQQLQEKCHQLFTYPLELFTQHKEQYQLYEKQDSHWSFWGCYLAYELLCQKLGISLNPDLIKGSMVATQVKGDLGAKFGLKYTTLQKKLTLNSQVIYDNQVINHAHQGSVRVLQNDRIAHGKMIIFGDSFCNPGIPDYSDKKRVIARLSTLFAETLNEVHFVWSPWIDYDYIEREQPDFVLSEMVERFLVRVPDDHDHLPLEEFVEKKLREFRVQSF
jgi:hypothetical protein